jgi:predicted secreted protein
MASPASLALDIPISQAGMSSYGFPSSLLQSSFSGLPADYMPPALSSSMPEAAFSLATTFMPSNLGPMAGYTSYFPEESSFGFPVMSGLGSPSSSPNLMGFPGLTDIVDQQFQGFTPQAVSGLSPASDAYTEASNGRTIKVKLGDTVKVQLDSRVDLGYTWNLSTTDGLNVTNSRVYPPKRLASDITAGTIALSSTQEWYIAAIKPGTQVINATYSQSLPGSGDRTFILKVMVE